MNKWRILKQNREAPAAGLLLLLLYGAALFAGFLAPYSPTEEFRSHFFHPPTTIHFKRQSGGYGAPYVNATYLADPMKHVFTEESSFPVRFFVRGARYKILGIFPSDLHLLGVDHPGHLFLLGTDQLGRDVFSRILYGAQISLTVGLIGVFITTCLGLSIGGIAGYTGGWTDALLMRIAEVVMSIPAFYLILSIRNIFPEQIGETHISSEATYVVMITVLSLTGWAGMSRVIRGMVLSLRKQEFILAAEAQGGSAARILVRHILPNTIGYVIVRATLLIPAYIIAEVTLSFLGLGIQEPSPSWGNMLSAAQELRVLQHYPWILAPAFFLFLTVLAFNFFGDGLRDALSEKQ